MEVFYFCFIVLIGLWLLQPLALTEFLAKKMRFWGLPTIITFFLLRKFRKKDKKTGNEEFVADSSRILNSAPPSLGCSNCGKPFVGKDPNNGKRCCVSSFEENAGENGGNSFLQTTQS